MITAYDLRGKPLAAYWRRQLATATREATAIKAMKTKVQNRFPPGWDEERVRRVLEHYENQSEDEAVVEDEAAFETAAGTLPEVRELINRYEQERKAS